MDAAAMERLWAEMSENPEFKAIVGAFDSVSKSTTAQRSTLKDMSAKLNTVATRFERYKLEAVDVGDSSSSPTPSTGSEQDLKLSQELLGLENALLQLDEDVQQDELDLLPAVDTLSSSSSSSSRATRNAESRSARKPKSSRGQSKRLTTQTNNSTRRKGNSSSIDAASLLMQQRDGLLPGMSPRSSKPIDLTSSSSSSSVSDHFVIAVPSRQQIQRTIRGQGGGLPSSGLMLQNDDDDSGGGGGGGSTQQKRSAVAVKHARQPVALSSGSTSNNSGALAKQRAMFNSRPPPATIVSSSLPLKLDNTEATRSQQSRTVQQQQTKKKPRAKRPGSASRHRMLRDATAIASEYDAADSAAVDDYSVQALIESMKAARAAVQPSPRRRKAQESSDDEDIPTTTTTTTPLVNANQEDEDDEEDAKFRVDNVRDYLKNMRRANQVTQKDLYIPTKHVSTRPQSASGKRSARRLQANLDPLGNSKKNDVPKKQTSNVVVAAPQQQQHSPGDVAPSPPRKEQSAVQQERRTRMLNRFNKRSAMRR